MSSIIYIDNFEFDDGFNRYGKAKLVVSNVALRYVTTPFSFLVTLLLLMVTTQYSMVGWTQYM